MIPFVSDDGRQYRDFAVYGKGRGRQLICVNRIKSVKTRRLLRLNRRNIDIYLNRRPSEKRDFIIFLTESFTGTAFGGSQDEDLGADRVGFFGL
ncbi:hypothetical protein V6667_04605 [Neisseria leonii]|uniref:hypothetical protein n=1 Tax=Neisseria leonii TaxID=2995413 RepID=UPI0030CAEBC0